MLFTVNEQYFEIRARRMAHTEDKTCVLIGITNLTKDTQSEKTGYLDDSVRRLYALYERITHLNHSEDSIRPLYTDTKEDMLSHRHGIKQLVGEYAERYIYPEDRDEFSRAFDPELAAERLRESGSVSFSVVFRTNIRHGQYAWKEYTLLKIDEDNYFLLVRNIHDIAKNFIEHNAAKPSEGGPYSPEQLWNNLIRSDLVRIFWKDRDRRFLGVNRGFLDFYGFSSAEELIGKNDEEMGWHVHPDLYMNDEFRVIHEGVTIRNVHGQCMSHGENRDICASKTPLYDENGEITGLIGCFTDIDSPSVSDQQDHNSPNRDLLTGLLNSRGISEDAEAFHDEYYLRGTDFVRMHIQINDFTMINEQYGFDFGDKVLYTLGSALEKGLGTNSTVGRYAGRKFAVLRQVANKEEARELCEKVKTIGDSIREIDGNPVTLYLSVGYTLYSECLDLENLTKNTEVRLHADYDWNISAESRIDQASELFNMFDNLPVPYAVFHLTHAERTGRDDAVFFYVNHRFEELVFLEAREILGHTVRELFPYLGDDWYHDLKSAALDGNVAEGEYDNPISGRHYRYTARQVIYSGYCAITCIETPVIKTRKNLLIADDAQINREMLGYSLSDDYDICYAGDGAETLETLKKDKGKIDLLILDLYMPNITGQEVLANMQADEELRSVPVIVLTSDKEAELESLKMGAMDFIPKPYPDIEIVKARIAKCIKLSERR
jgi:diguanylate cyclase (GGDEF)-like protein/PAS domain S-box-containing protein